MREIKFRAWSKKEQRWYHKVIEWVFAKPKGSIGQLPLLPEGVVFSQYTGLKDKNGKEIYEGDIIRLTIINERLAIVKWDRGQFIMYIDTHKLYFDDFYYTFGENAINREVIGNIYENPELLEVKIG